MGYNMRYWMNIGYEKVRLDRPFTIFGHQSRHTQQMIQSEILSTTFNNVIFFSYRNNFPTVCRVDQESLRVSRYGSDTGWGCMIRCL